MKKEYKTFKDFYPFYLSQHKSTKCRLLHFIGVLLVIINIIISFLTHSYEYIILGFGLGYFFAWMGHLLFEKNRPATFQYPLFSFFGDIVMFKDILIGKIKIF